MIVEIQDLEEPLHIRHVYDAADLNFKSIDAYLQEQVYLDAVVTRKESDVRVRGRFKTTLNFICSRCLRDFKVPLDQDFDLFYTPVSAAAQEEIELKYEDMNVAYYDGTTLDIDMVVVEQLVLAVPMKPICKETCKGLCEQCGADLNVERCSCQREDMDPRLAPLLEFKRKFRM